MEGPAEEKNRDNFSVGNGSEYPGLFSGPVHFIRGTAGKTVRFTASTHTDSFIRDRLKEGLFHTFFSMQLLHFVHQPLQQRTADAVLLVVHNSLHSISTSSKNVRTSPFSHRT
jgi:hypothetical protein